MTDTNKKLMLTQKRLFRKKYWSNFLEKSCNRERRVL